MGRKIGDAAVRPRPIFEKADTEVDLGHDERKKKASAVVASSKLPVNKKQEPQVKTRPVLDMRSPALYLLSSRPGPLFVLLVHNSCRVTILLLS